MKINDFLNEQKPSVALRGVLRKSLYDAGWRNLCLQNDFAAEEKLFHDKQQRVAGVYTISMYTNALAYCFAKSFNDIKQQVKKGATNISVCVSDYDENVIENYMKIGPAAFKRGNSVDVYGLHGLSLNFKIDGDEIKCSKVGVDWSSVDGKVSQSDRIREVALKSLRMREANLQNRVNELGLNTVLAPDELEL